MSEERIQRPKYVSAVKVEQLYKLFDFLAQHEELALGTSRHLEVRRRCRVLWEKVAQALNAYKGGRKRNARGWNKYWTDFKMRLRKKLDQIEKKQLGDITQEVSPLTKLERKALEILGPNIRTCHAKENGTESSSKKHLSHGKKPAKLRLNNKFHKVKKLSSKKKEEPAEVEDAISEDIYPDWLIEVESTRADADLRRAKAEELRAEVAVKNAEAALIQSQAIKKLADAADKQALAFQRIAEVLETRII